MKQGIRKEQIYEKAMELFSQKGYDGTSMENIANAVGIRKATLYFHVSSKEAIFTELFNRILDEHVVFIERITNFDASISTREKLYYIFREYAFYNRHNANMKFWDRFYYFPPEDFKEYIYEKTSETSTHFLAKLVEIFRMGVEKQELNCVNPENVAYTFYYLLMGFVLSTSYYSTGSFDEEVNRCLEAFIRGI